MRISSGFILFKSILLLTFVFMASNAFGEAFILDDIELLINKRIKVKEKVEKLQEYGYDLFYVSRDME